jgi:hypothetical protein
MLDYSIELTSERIFADKQTPLWVEALKGNCVLWDTCMATMGAKRKLTQVPAAISSTPSNIFSAVVALNCHIYNAFGEFEANSIAGTKATGRFEIVIDTIIQ